MSIEDFEVALKGRLVREFAAFEAVNLYVDVKVWSANLTNEQWRIVMMYLHGTKHDQYMTVVDLPGLDACLMRLNLNTKIHLTPGWWAELTMLRLIDNEH